VWCNKSWEPTVHKKQKLTICCHLYIRVDMLLHKTLPTRTHLSFHVTSQWPGILYCFALTLYHASILHPPQALVLKNIQRVFSDVKIHPTKHEKGDKNRQYQSCPQTEWIHTLALSRISCQDKGHWELHHLLVLSIQFTPEMANSRSQSTSQSWTVSSLADRSRSLVSL
jgi:hypothetical protein